MISTHPHENNPKLTTTTAILHVTSILVIIFMLLKPIASYGLGKPSSYINQQQDHRTLALLLSYDGCEGGRFCGSNKGECKGGRHEYRCINDVVNHCVWNLIGQPSGNSNMTASVVIDTGLIVCGSVSASKDEGEHALGQVAMFVIPQQSQRGFVALPKLFYDAIPDVNLIRHKLNRQMPPHVMVRRSAVLNGIFRADTDIKGIQCSYTVCDWDIDIPLLLRRQWHIPQPKGRRLDFKAMCCAAEKLCTMGNPSSVAASLDPHIMTTSSCDDLVCQLESIEVLETPGAPGRFKFVFKGDRFIYQFVKGFARALVAIGEKRLCPDKLLGDKANELQSCFLTRKLRGMPYAPNYGLCLERVLYNPSDDPFEGDAVISSSSDGFYRRTTVDADSIACRYYKQMESRTTDI